VLLKFISSKEASMIWMVGVLASDIYLVSRNGLDAFLSKLRDSEFLSVSNLNYIFSKQMSILGARCAGQPLLPFNYICRDIVGWWLAFAAVAPL
jgi:hypothetical protein